MNAPALILDAAGLALLSALFCGLLTRAGLRDAPDGVRKFQARAVPNSGGLGIAAAVAVWAAAASLLSGAAPLAGYGALVLAVLAAVLIGFADDARGMPARLKLALLVLVALGAALAGPPLAVFDFRGLGLAAISLAPWIAIGGAALWLVVMANAVNFMDGANGIAMGSAAIMLGVLACLFWQGGPAAPAVLSIWTLAALLGFLFWNLAGRLYAGDSGALGIGLLLGLLGLEAARAGSVWTAPTLVLPFLADVFLTLILRARRGDRLFEAHRDHAYQLFLRAGWPHWKVAGLWWGFTAVSGLAAVMAAPRAALPAFVLLLAISVALWLWQRVTLGRRLEAGGGQ
jgi:UDP-GlcNAc:undecaprenyl-phosphate GlcNAc-1-phosphate transferase